ncbi:MAG: metallophosphoesterase [Bacteroidales bacterium]
MFHTILTLSYLLPNIYLFLRIRQLFIPRKALLIYILVYLLIASLYPLSNINGDSSSSFILKLLESVSAYLLPLYLYIFLLVLFFDLFLLANLLFGFLRRPVINREGSGLKVFALILSAAILIVVAGVINFNTIRISEYNIEVPARLSHPGGLKIAYVSDFHLQNNTPAGFVERFVKKVEKANPDILIFGGDLVEGDRDDGNLSVFEKKIRGIKTKYGTYGVLGNHEHYSGQDKGGFFDKAGIHILSDSAVVIDRAFTLAGRNDRHSRSRLTISELMSKVNDSYPVILLDHRPDEIDSLAKYKVDIQLSGHTHNGQMFPVNLITGRVYKLSYGFRKFGNTNVFVSSGIRLWGFPVRTAGKSEIVVVNARFI